MYPEPSRYRTVNSASVKPSWVEIDQVYPYFIHFEHWRLINNYFDKKNRTWVMVKPRNNFQYLVYLRKIVFSIIFVPVLRVFLYITCKYVFVCFPLILVMYMIQKKTQLLHNRENFRINWSKNVKSDAKSITIHSFITVMI